MNLTEEKNNLDLYLTQCDKQAEAAKTRLAEINKQLEQQPKEGEWWCGVYSDKKFIVRVKNIGNGRINHYEYYSETYYESNGYVYISNLTCPATTSDIEYFMGLHAERLKMVEGSVIDNGGDYGKWTLGGLEKYEFDNGVFKRFSDNDFCHKSKEFDNGCLELRNSEGTWATVVKEAEKPKKLVKKSVNLQRKIDKLEADNAKLRQAIQQIKDLMNGID